MPWTGFGKAERMSGTSGKVSTVKMNVKTNSKGRPTDILVSKSSNPHRNHEHYSLGRGRDWKSTKGKG